MPTSLDSFDLTQLPGAEDDEYEFKSSQTALAELKKKLAQAASGFANTGGGCFVAGVDGAGNANVGFAQKVGNQDLRDWCDQVIHQVEPSPSYEIKIIEDAQGRGVIQPGNAVIVVRFPESYVGPHMAPDNRYYIRAGAHTVPARHFIVEALWARRHFAKPRLVHVASVRLWTNVTSHMAIELATITSAPALGVEVDLSPRPDDEDLKLPLKATLIDSDHPFGFQFEFNHDPPGHRSTLTATYHDSFGNKYNYSANLDSSHCVDPFYRLRSDADRIVEAIHKLRGK